MACISTDTYMQAGGHSAYPGLELVMPVAVSCWLGVEDDDPKSKVKSLEEMVDMLNGQLCRKAEKAGITHIFSVRYSSSMTGKGKLRSVQYKAIGNGYRQKKVIR